MKTHNIDELGVFISQVTIEQKPKMPSEVGPLSNVVYAAKDNIDALGFATTAGTPSLLNNQPKSDSSLVSRLRASGARLIGKTNLHELCLGLTSNNGFFGPVRNPYDPSRVAGGSSGGSAAACALGIVDFALGTDTGGSVRNPASYCGVFGFRPSTGRYPSDGIVGLSNSRDSAGIISSSLEMIIRVDAVIAGEDKLGNESSCLTIGLPKYFWSGLDEDLERRATEVIQQLQEKGHKMVWIEEPKVFERSSEVAMTIVVYEVPREIQKYLDSSDAHLSLSDVFEEVSSPDVKNLLSYAMASPIDNDKYLAAQDEVGLMKKLYEDLWENNHIDVLIYPTVPMYAPPLGEDDKTLLNGELVSVFSTSVRNLELTTLVGSPSISVPVKTDGPNFGIVVEGRPNEDRLLLSQVSGLINENKSVFRTV